GIIMTLLRRGILCYHRYHSQKRAKKALFLIPGKVQTQKVSLLICQLCEDVIYY
ncbi:hypothetical protein GS389_001243, partial [Salmonella enterica subsp. enterica serovar Kentucky]|nr:hypothetical protein [Salmonella enterica subsp. enterica serovar Javiana]EEI1672627.1 hypothetical protein [Salmonella enterica subsp. enterica serovar Kentucky]